MGVVNNTDRSLRFTIGSATHKRWVAHNLERVTDCMANICERVLFLVTGRMVEI